MKTGILFSGPHVVTQALKAEEEERDLKHEKDMKMEGRMKRMQGSHKELGETLAASKETQTFGL